MTDAFTADAVANEFLANFKGFGITPMKLQKLVYYAHAWYLANYDEPLISEPIQAWRYGPVIQSLYSEFRDFRNEPINRLAIELEMLKTDGPGVRIRRYEPRLSDASFQHLQPERAAAHVGAVWNALGRFSATQLSNMTHQPNEPWLQIRNEFDGSIPKAVAIPNELIKQCFKEIKRQHA